MGSCLANPATEKQSKRSLVFNSEATESTSHNYELEFYCEISQVTILNCPYKQLSLEFSIQDVCSFMFAEKDATIEKSDSPVLSKNSQHKTQTLNWDAHCGRSFSINETNLRKKYLNISAIDHEGRKAHEIKICLFLIATGPFHHNIQIFLSDNKSCRLVFDCKISEIFETFFEIGQINLELYRQYPGQQFNFSLKTQNDGQDFFRSEHSYPIKIPFNHLTQRDYENTLFVKECASPVDLRKPKLFLDQNEEKKVSKHSITWKRELVRHQSSQKYMPNFIVDVNASLISKYHLQILVWSIKESDKTDDVIETVLFGETNLPFWRLFEKEFNETETVLAKKSSHLSQSEIKNVKTEERLITLTEKICKNDRTVLGECKFTIKMKNPSYFKQNKYCTRTEDGIINYVPSLKCQQNYLVFKEKNKSASEILEVFENFQSLFKNTKEGSSYAQQKIKTELNRVNFKIKESANESLFFKGQSQVNDIMYNQNILMTILQRIYDYIICEDSKSDLSEIAWEIIVSILKRSEFCLQNFVLNNLERKNNYEDLQKNHEKRKQNGLKYQQILYRLLIAALDSGRYFMLKDSQHVGFFLALCYFRVPLFRQYVLFEIQQEANQEIIQKRLLELQENIEPHTSGPKVNKTYFEKFNWEEEFFNILKNQKQYNTITNQLEKSMKKSHWIKQIGKNEEKFCGFVTRTIKKLVSIETTNPQKWKYFPGYNRIICVFLTKMKNKQISTYSPEMIRASVNLLQNQHLINILMPLICESTNRYDFENVIFSIDLLTEFFEVLTKKGQSSFSITFNYSYFFSLVKVIFESEHCYTISKFLTLLYNYYYCFNQEFRNNLSFYFLGEVFFKLFLNWSSDVRHAFFSILIYRVNYQELYFKNKPTSTLANTLNKEHQIALREEITQRYAKVIDLVKIAESIKHDEDKDKIIQKYEKQYYKKMKKKMYLKFRNRDKENEDFSNRQSKITSKYCLQNLYNLWYQQNQQKSNDFSKTCINLEKMRMNIPSQTSSNNFNVLYENKREQNQSLAVDLFSKTIDLHKSRTTLDNHQLEHEVQHLRKKMQPKMSEDVDKQKNTPSKKHRLTIAIPEKISSRKYTFNHLTLQQNQLEEMTMDQQKCIMPALSQFKELEEFVEKYIFTHDGKLPDQKLEESFRNQIKG